MDRISPESKLGELGIELPKPISPIGAYIPYKVVGKHLWISGMIPVLEGKLVYEGKVGQMLTLEQAQECAKVATFNALSWAREAVGSLEKIKGVIRLQGFIASADGFYEHPKVLNSASDLLLALFGEEGRHTRIAVGVYSLPLNAPLEIDFLFELI